ARDLRAAELRAGTRRPSRLVRGVGGVERRACAAAGLFDAQHGEWSSFPSRVSAGDPTGLPRSPRVRIQVFWRRLSAAAVRQLESRGEEDPARVPPRGNHALHRLPLALALPERVLYAVRSAREGRYRERGRLLPTQPLGADAESTGSRRPQRPTAGCLSRR